MIERLDIEGTRKDPLTKLIFKYKDQTEEKNFDDINEGDRIVYRVDKNLDIKCEKWDP